MVRKIIEKSFIKVYLVKIRLLIIKELIKQVILLRLMKISH